MRSLGRHEGYVCGLRPGSPEVSDHLSETSTCTQCTSLPSRRQGRPGERVVSSDASVAMIHSIPELHVSEMVRLQSFLYFHGKPLVRVGRRVLDVSIDIAPSPHGLF